MPTPSSWRLTLALCAFLALGAGQAIAQDKPPVIAAAADLKFAVAEIAAAFEADTGNKVEVSLGSTGNFAAQIRQGAPFQMFMAADERFIKELAAEGLARDEGTLYAVGRIVIMLPHGSVMKADMVMDDLAAMIDSGTLTKFAIANPEHAPYGMRAKEALKYRGLWEKIQPYLILGENVSQTAQFALSGNAEGGIIALSLASAPEIAARGEYALIPDEWHEPLFQRMALMNNAGPIAEEFYAYIQQPKAREIMVKYGFVLLEED